MSKITTIYNQWETVVESLLPSYTKIVNPYQLDDNPEILMRSGYGILMGPAINRNRILSCKVSIERTFSMFLVNHITTTPNQKVNMANLEKAIMEDQFLILKDIELNASLTAAERAAYQGDGGIEFLEGESSRHLLLETQFLVEYFEDLTS